MSSTKAPWIFGAKDNRHRGVEVDNDGQLLTVSQAIVQGGLDWMVELRHPASDDDDIITAPEWRQVVKVEDSTNDQGQLIKLYRTLGMVKGRYTLLQNRAAFKFFDRATLEGAAVIKAVGHLDHGRVVWAVAQRPDTMELYPGDVIHQNLVLVTAHDGSHAVKVMFTPYRQATGTMVGFRTARRQRTEVRVRHTKSIETRMATVHNVLAAESGFFDRWRAALVGDEAKGVKGFKQRLVSQTQIDKVVSSLFPAQRKLDEDGNTVTKVSGKAQKARGLILDRIKEQEERAKIAYADADQKAPNGVTALDVFLGVSEYVAKDRKAKNEGNNWVVSTFGTGADMRQKAFDLIAGL
jgi:phage/plasmid-like protein (TIGR03299 family)